MRRDWINCNTCGANAYQVMAYSGEWPIGKCTRCGLIYVNPIPVFEPSDEFSEMSQEFVYTQFMHNSITNEILDHDGAQLSFQRQKIAQLTGENWPQIRLLEVGCGSGAAVRAAVDHGWEATGLDIDPQLIESGRRQLNVDLRCTPLLEAGLPANHYHFVRLRDVIEHLPNPYEVLLEIKRILVPGGVLLLATPNEAGLPTQLRLMMGGKRRNVATVPPPHHLHGFTMPTLQKILQRAGLQTLETLTTTPVDPAYVTANNMKSLENRFYVAFWRGAKALGRGSMLIAWARKVGCSDPPTTH